MCLPASSIRRRAAPPGWHAQKFRGDIDGGRQTCIQNGSSPGLDVTGGRVVKGVNFVDLKDAGDPVEIGRAYDAAGADELVFLDITASSDNRATVADMVRRVAETVFIPLQWEGGIRTVGGLPGSPSGGGRIRSPSIPPRSRPPGSSRTRRTSSAASAWWSRSMPREGLTDQAGISTRTAAASMWGRTPLEWAVQVEKLGAGELLLTSMDCDGTKAGYDLELTRAVADAVSIPVIASGGAGTLEHFREALAEAARMRRWRRPCSTIRSWRSGKSKSI